MLIRHRHGAGHIQFRTSWTNGKFTVIISKTRRRSTHIRSSRQQPERPRAEDPASQNEASTAAVRQNGHRNVNRSTTPPAVKLDDLAEEGSLSEIRCQFWNRYRTKHLAVIIPFRQLAFDCHREQENASFSLRHMEESGPCTIKSCPPRCRRIRHLSLHKGRGRRDSGAQSPPAGMTGGQRH